MNQDLRDSVYMSRIVVININNEKPILVITISKLSLANQSGRHPKPTTAQSHNWKTWQQHDDISSTSPVPCPIPPTPTFPFWRNYFVSRHHITSLYVERHLDFDAIVANPHSTRHACTSGKNTRHRGRGRGLLDESELLDLRPTLVVVC